MSTLDEATTLELPFKPPFDWPRLLRFFGGRATPGVEAVEDGAYRRAIDWAGDSGTLSVRLHPRKRCLVASIEGPVSRHADALALLHDPVKPVHAFNPLVQISTSDNAQMEETRA